MAIIIFIIFALVALAYWRELSGCFLLVALSAFGIWFLFKQPELSIVLAIFVGIYFLITHIVHASVVSSDYKKFSKKKDVDGLLQVYSSYSNKRKKAMLSFLSKSGRGGFMKKMLGADFLQFVEKNIHGKGFMLLEQETCFNALQDVHQKFQEISFDTIANNIPSDWFIEGFPLQEKGKKLPTFMLKAGRRDLIKDIFSDSKAIDLDD